MHLAHLRAVNFRRFETLSLQLHRRLNFVFGANAAGKTSLLESIYCLSRGKSFRGTSPAELAGPAGRHWAVGASWTVGEGPRRSVDVKWDGAVTRLRLDRREDLVASELVRLLPVQVLEPGMHKLLQEGPGYRRSFLDWGVFHVEHGFLPAWRRFQRALRQRNQALRAGSAPREIQAWDAELAGSGAQIDRYRRTHLDALRPALAEHIQALLGEAGGSVELASGWPGGQDYAEALRAGLVRDRKLGQTAEGPHRAELRIRLDRHAVKNRISRGQQKLLIAALLLAQAREVERAAQGAPILLVDDFSSELGEQFQQRFLAVLRAYPGQLFVTSFERGGVLAAVPDCAMFHVEHGELRGA